MKNMTPDTVFVKPKKKRNYVNNPDFHACLKLYIKAVRKAKREKTEAPRIPEYVGACINQICNRLSLRPNFFSYTWRDEMVHDAIENCIMAVDNYKIDKEIPNPFAYFTMIAWNAMIRRIQKEKKQTYIKHKNFQNSFIVDDLMAEFNISNPSDYKSEDVVRDFEDKIAANKKKKKKAKKNGIENFEA